jgi:hypothetical protein
MKDPSRRSAAVAFTAAFLALASAIAGGEQLPSPGARIWIAEIVFHRIGDGTRTVDESTPQRTRTQSATHKADEVVKIKACGAVPYLYVTEAKRTTLSESTHKESVDEFVQASCWPEEAKGHTALYVRSKLKPEIKRPGDSSRTTEDSAWAICPRSDNPSLDKLAQVSLVRIHADEYQLLATYKDYVKLTKDAVTKATTACTGATSISEDRTRTTAPGGRFDWKRSQSGDDQNKRTVTETTLPPILLPTLFGTTVVLDRNSVSDSTPVSETKPTPANGEYAETTTALWSLTVKDGCDDVHAALLEGLALGEAYADPTIQSSAKSVDEYEAATCIRAWEIMHGGQEPPAGEDPCEDAGETDPRTGKVTGNERLFEKVARSCKPRVIADSGAAHESMHQVQIRVFGSEMMNTTDLTFRGQRDQEAYAVGAAMLLSWLKANCPGKDLSAEEARLQKITPPFPWRKGRRG